MIKWKANELIDKKFHNKNQFSKASGLGYPAVCKIYDGKTTNVQLSTIETLCNTLECSPNDLFVIEHDN